MNLFVPCRTKPIVAGFYAYNTVAHDAPSHAAMTNHKNWALTTSASFLILILWSVILYQKNKKQNLLFIGCLVVATSLLSITGWKGGEIVYRYGLGVISLPNLDTHQHKADMPSKHRHKNPTTLDQKKLEKSDHSHSR